MQNLKNMPGVESALEGVRHHLETYGDINNVLEEHEKCDWYGLSGMPDLLSKKELTSRDMVMVL